MADVYHMVEFLRRKMIQRANESGSLGDPAVIQISQQLDLVLVQMQRYYNMKIQDERQHAQRRGSFVQRLRAISENLNWTNNKATSVIRS